MFLFFSGALKVSMRGSRMSVLSANVNRPVLIQINWRIKKC